MPLRSRMERWHKTTLLQMATSGFMNFQHDSHNFVLDGIINYWAITYALSLARNLSLMGRGRLALPFHKGLSWKHCKLMSPRQLSYDTGNLSYVTDFFCKSNTLEDLNCSFIDMGRLCRTCTLILKHWFVRRWPTSHLVIVAIDINFLMYLWEEHMRKVYGRSVDYFMTLPQRYRGLIITPPFWWHLS